MFGFNIRLREEPGGGITSVRTQHARPLILDTLAEMRKAHPMSDRDGLGRWALSVPFEDWLAIRERYPDLKSPDAATRSRAWLRFIRSPESVPFRVRTRV